MPTYEYECSTCSKTFDVVQPMSDAPLEACPSCGNKVRRIIGGGLGIIFKGSGFYVNDSKRAAAAATSKTLPSGDKAADKAGDKAGATKPGGSEAACAGCGAAKNDCPAAKEAS